VHSSIVSIFSPLYSYAPQGCYIVIIIIIITISSKCLEKCLVLLQWYI